MELAEQNGELCLGGVRLGALADRLGTPLVIYDAESLIERFYRFVEAFSAMRAMVCFAADASGNTQVMHRLVKRGAGLRVRTAADLERAWLCGAPMSRVVYSGLGKSEDDLRAALDGLYSPLFQAGRLVEGKPPYYRGPVGWIGVETGAEIEQLARLAGGVRIACKVMVRVALPECASSVNGSSPDETAALFERFAPDPRVRVAGLRVHLGRAGVSAEKFASAAGRLCLLADRLEKQGTPVAAIDLGGGMACDAWDSDAPPPEEYARAAAAEVMPCVERGVKLIIEPGWSIAAAGTVMVSRVLAVQGSDGGPTVIVDGLPGEPAELTRLRPMAVRPPAAAAAACHVCHLDAPGRMVRAEGAFEPGSLIAWPGGGAYARRGPGEASEVLLENGRALIVRTRRTIAEAVAPELETHEVIL